jgi:serine/threonine protein kinase
MGDIYLAEQPELGRQVAVKVIQGEDSLMATPASREKATQQFVREARAIAALEHPHIIPIYDFGEQDGTRYLVMQYVALGSLADFVTSSQLPRYKLPLHPILVADIIDQAASALQFAHDRQIVHLDVKPQNLLVRILPGSTTTTPSSYHYQSDLSYEAFSNEPTVQITNEVLIQLHILLADFGLARSITWTSSHSGLAGTPLYTAPEQYSGRASPASDQYALAGVAYLLLTGRPVFNGTLAEVYHHHLTVTPPPATEANPLLPPGVNGVLLRALAKDSPQRFARISDFAQALRLSVSTANQAEQALWQPTLPVSIIDKLTAPSFPPSSPGPAATPFPGQPISPAGPGGWSSPPPVIVQPTPSPVPSWGSQPQFPPSGQGTPASLFSQPGAHFSAPPLTATPAGAWPASPDMSRPPVPGVPLQKLPRRRLSLNTLSARQRFVFGGLALIIILGSLSAVLVGVLLHQKTTSPPPTTVNPIHSRLHTVTGYGLHDLASVPAITSNTAAKQYTLPARYKWSSEEADNIANAATNIKQLPSLSQDKGATISVKPSNGPSGPAATSIKGGLGQPQVGINSPMDISVASGNNFLFEAVDGTLLISGPSGNRVVSLATFFAPMFQAGNVIGEARVLYDPTRDRWILVANQLRISNGAVTQGFFNVAMTTVSGAPLGTWYFYQFNTQIPTYREQCNWADYPQIGINGTSIFITGTSFACGQNGAFLGADLWELPRKEFLSGNTKSVYSWTGFINAQGHPVVTLTPAVEGGADTTEWLLADDAGYADLGQVSNKLSLWALNDTSSASTGGSSSPASITAGVVTLPSPYADPPAAEQKGTSIKLTTGDARIAQAQLTQGHLFAAFTTAVNWTGNAATKAGIYWFDLIPSLNSSPNNGGANGVRASVAQQSILGLSDGYIFYPSLVVDPQRNVVLFAELSSRDRYSGLIFASRSQDSPPNTFGQGNPSTLLQAGNGPFTGAHWGDYAQGSLGFSQDKKQTFICMAGVYPGSNATGWQTSLWKFDLAA